jgi:hypothetical protein
MSRARGILNIFDFEDAPRPSPDDGRWAMIYVRSYLRLRLAIGLLGLLLPVVLVLVVDVIEGKNPAARGSFSVYYYSGAREIFVGTLCVVGVFLIGYKFSARSRDGAISRESKASTISGFGAVVVALFPTSRPDKSLPLTPLQDALSENAVKNIHYIAAAVFILSLAYLCFYFAYAEGPKSQRPDKSAQRLTPSQWQLFHRVCGGFIIAAVAGFGLVKVFQLPDRYALFITELVSTWAFAISWLAKAWEWKILKLATPSP